jgi:hypothetical protein
MIAFHDPGTGAILHLEGEQWVGPGGSPVYPLVDGVARFLDVLDSDVSQVFYPPAPYLQGPGTDLLRVAMRRLSDEQRYQACKHLVIRNRYLAHLLGGFVMVGYYDKNDPAVDPETQQFGLFDAYSPRWNHRHTADEVVRWFREEGFREVTVVDPGTHNVRVRGQLPV